MWGGPPCTRCTVEMIQAGITEVVAYPPKAVSKWKEHLELARTLLEEAGVGYREVQWGRSRWPTFRPPPTGDPCGWRCHGSPILTPRWVYRQRGMVRMTTHRTNYVRREVVRSDLHACPDFTPSASQDIASIWPLRATYSRSGH